MRTRAIVIVAIGVLAAVAAVLSLNRGGSGEPPALAAKTVRVGEIDVTIAPHHLDATGARIDVTLDTHTTELGMPLTGMLQVGGTAWQGGDWRGDPATGHHRAGRFSFSPSGAATGTVRFALGGFAEPVITTWALALDG